MMLESLISAYVLAAISLEGARSSERQMVASSWLLMTASLSFSYASPIEQMHPQRPLRSLFHPTIFLSLCGQALIHLYTMHTAVSMATEAMGPDKLAEVVEFHRRERLREEKEAQTDKAMEEGDYMAAAMAMWSTPFLPNLLNTCVFLVETAQCIAVIVVNYKGRPWMKGIMENHPLFLSVAATVAGCAGCAWGVSPEFNALIHLEPFPDDPFRWKIMGLVGASIAGTFVWDRLCTALFAPSIFKVMIQQARETSLKDMLPALQSLGKVIIGFTILATGNLLFAGLAYFAWKRLKQQEAQQQ
jgi:cation-transporting ATPase 13A1